MHNNKNLVGVLKKVHEEIAATQGKWWEKIVREKGFNDLQDAYARIDLDDFIRHADELNNVYSQYFVRAGGSVDDIIDVGKQLRKVGGEEGFRLGRASRFKQIGVLVNAFAIFDLFCKKGQAALNIANHNAVAWAAWDSPISQYETCIDEACGTSGVISYNRIVHLKDAFVNYLLALGFSRESTEVTSMDVMIELWIGLYGPPAQ